MENLPLGKCVKLCVWHRARAELDWYYSHGFANLSRVLLGRIWHWSHLVAHRSVWYAFAPARATHSKASHALAFHHNSNHHGKWTKIQTNFVLLLCCYSLSSATAKRNTTVEYQINARLQLQSIFLNKLQSEKLDCWCCTLIRKQNWERWDKWKLIVCSVMLLNACFGVTAYDWLELLEMYEYILVVLLIYPK